MNENKQESELLCKIEDNSAVLSSMGERIAEEGWGEEEESKQDEQSSEYRGYASVGHLPI